MGVKLSKLMMRQYKDGVYRMSRATVAKHVAFLEFRLMDAEQLANERGEKRDILYNENAALKREVIEYAAMKQYLRSGPDGSTKPMWHDVDEEEKDRYRESVRDALLTAEESE